MGTMAFTIENTTGTCFGSAYNISMTNGTMTTSTSPWMEITTLGDPPPVYIPDRNTPGHPEFRIPSGRAKCPACGQWGEREHACDYCGHPVD
jgi:hypothetical protein